ncbi:MAG: hypothetical protein K8T91_14895 [Planctomycetes bacterium]|nr:hypothetical protein [Planctomycetota bacterium]
MLTSVEGIYRDGKVELIGPAPEMAAGRVIVTFLNATTAVDLAARGIDQKQANELRHRLGTIADDWQHPDMDVYDAV